MEWLENLFIFAVIIFGAANYVWHYINLFRGISTIELLNVDYINFKQNIKLNQLNK